MAKKRYSDEDNLKLLCRKRKLCPAKQTGQTISLEAAGVKKKPRKLRGFLKSG